MREREPLTRAEWQVMRVCWEAGPASARALHELSLAEASPVMRVFGRWSIRTFRITLDRIVAKGYLRTEPATQVVLRSRGGDRKWDVVDFVAEILGDPRKAAAGVTAVAATRPFLVLETFDKRRAAKVVAQLEKLGAKAALREGPLYYVPTVSMEDAVRTRSSSFIDENLGDDPAALKAHLDVVKEAVARGNQER